jgi:hypothetical protein
MKKKTTTEQKVKRPVGRPRKTVIRLGKLDTSFDSKAIRDLTARIAELEYQNIGFRSVISYLETQLGLKQTQ